MDPDRRGPPYSFLIGFRNRLSVVLNWGWNYVTFQRGTRLITGISGSRIEDVMPAVPMAPPLAVLEAPTGNRYSSTAVQ